MGFPRIELLAGVVNGINTDFTTPTPYTPNTLTAIVDGQLREKSLDDGFIEQDPDTGLVRFKIAPLTGSLLQAFYIDRSFSEEVQELRGNIQDTENVAGAIQSQSEVSAALMASEQITATLENQTEIQGHLNDIEYLTGFISEDDE